MNRPPAREIDFSRLRARRPLRQPEHEPQKMNGSVLFLSGAGLGAGLVYFFDPVRGRRHRALARDKINRLYHTAPDFASKAGKDLSNRARGIVAETRSALTQEPVPDEILVERVRAKIGRIVTHPGSIDVAVRDGVVTLRGPILKNEVKPLLSCVRRVRGVAAVEDQLTVHESSTGIPGLQGGSIRPGDRMEWMQETWAPGPRLLAVASGGALGLVAARSRGIPGVITGLAGTGLLLRGLANRPLKQVFGMDGSCDIIEIHKTITVDGPVDEVFKLWTDFENYHRFMDHVREIRANGDGRLHWSVIGPAGSTVEWDAEITKMIPNDLITWRTVEGAPVRQEGRTRFTQNPDGTTRIDVHLAYCPPAGVLGHMVATAFGVDPKRSMEEDLVRFQSLFAYGKTTAHGETVTLDELEQAQEARASGG